MSGGYPAGAANDSRAPYNQSEEKWEADQFTDTIDIGSGDPVEIEIAYEYLEVEGYKHIREMRIINKFHFLIHEFGDMVEECVRARNNHKVIF